MRLTVFWQSRISLSLIFTTALLAGFGFPSPAIAQTTGGIVGTLLIILIILMIMGRI